MCKINLFGIKYHFIHISLFYRNNGNMIQHIFKQSWSSPMNMEFFCSPNICCSKYDTRIQAEADNTGNEPRNLQRKKLLTVSSLILSSKFMSTFMFISVNCSKEYGIRQLKCWTKFYELWTPKNFCLLGPQNKNPWMVWGNCSSPPTVCLLLHSPVGPPV